MSASVHWRQPMLVLALAMAAGAVARLAYLDAIAPWTDEFATLVFSLGHGFKSIALDRWMTASELLSPLRNYADNSIADVVRHLSIESTHPPIYFILTHGWIDVWGPSDEVALVVAARCLSAIFGLLCIPAIYLLCRRFLASGGAAGLAALLMALSPLAVMLGREARHYSLGMLMVIVSLSLFLRVSDGLRQSRRLPGTLLAAWLMVNILGVGVHYLFAVAILAQTITLVAMRCRRMLSFDLNRQRLMALLAAYGILLAAWAPVWKPFLSSNLLAWTSAGRLALPVSMLRLLVWQLFSFSVLPRAVIGLPPVVSAAIVLAFLVVIGVIVRQVVAGNRAISRDPDNRGWVVHVLVYYGVSVLALFLCVQLIFGKDLSVAPRYCFLVLPVVVILAAAGLGVSGGWRLSRPAVAPAARQARLAAVLLIGLAMGGSAMVVIDPDYLLNHSTQAGTRIIMDTAQRPVAIASLVRHHGQTGKMMAVAWTVQRMALATGQPESRSAPVYALIDQARCNGSQPWQELIGRLEGRREVWTINSPSLDGVQAPGLRKDDTNWAHLIDFQMRRYVSALDPGLTLPKDMAHEP